MRIRVAHASLQFGDTDKQHTADITKIFERATDREYVWIMGTETGPGAGNTGEELLRIGRDADYKLWIPIEQTKGAGRSTDCWIAVRKDLVVSGWETNFIPAIPSSSQLYKEQGLKPDLNPRWGPKGLVTVEFTSIPELGDINLVVAHHLTKGQRKGPESIMRGVDHWKWNEKMDDKIGEWLAAKSKGKALGFASMDRNASDRKNPASIPGATTLGDELKKYENTGHGDIDWILSVDKDSRVKGTNLTVLDDKEFFLNMDHFLVEGVFNIEPLKNV